MTSTKRNPKPIHTGKIPGDHTARLKATREKARAVMRAWVALSKASGDTGKVSAPAIKAHMDCTMFAESVRSVRYHLYWLIEHGYLVLASGEMKRGIVPHLKPTKQGHDFARDKSKKV